MEGRTESTPGHAAAGRARQPDLRMENNSARQLLRSINRIEKIEDTKNGWYFQLFHKNNNIQKKVTFPQP